MTRLIFQLQLWSAGPEVSNSTIPLSATLEMEKNKQKLYCVVAVLVLAAMAAIGVSVTIFTGKTNKVSRSTTDNTVPGGATDTDDIVSPTLTPSSITTTLSMAPSVSRSDLPSSFPSTMPSINPSARPTPPPSTMPITASPTNAPSLFPSLTPSLYPSVTTEMPTGCSRTDKTEIAQEASGASCEDIAIFYAIADVPYDLTDRLALPKQILDIPETAEFLIHLGDIRSAAQGDKCTLRDYQDMSAMLKLSKVPVFIVVGDNEWNDCSNINTAWGYWEQELMAFENHWSHNFDVLRHANRPENFAFAHKRTLYIGLNLVGGAVHKPAEWNERHTELSEWTIDLMRDHTGGDSSVAQVRSVVIFGHAHPTIDHDDFFLPLNTFLRQELAGDIPVLYMNGDSHEWSYDPSYKGVESFLRIQLTGGTSEPPLQVIIAPTDDVVDSNAENVFLYDRRLSAS